MSDQTPEASAVEALDRWISTHGGALMEGDIDGLLDFLASDWLAAHVAAARADERALVLGEVEKDVPLATRLADPGDYVREQLIEGDFGDPWDMPLWQREHLARVIEAFTSVTPSAPTHADEEDRAAMSIDPEPPGATLRPFTPAEAEALDLREQAGDER